MKLVLSILLLVVGVAIEARAASAEKGDETSDHFEGSRFFTGEPDYSFFDMIKWMATMNVAQWPEWIDDSVRRIPLSRVGEGELTVTFVNHATVLIQMDGLNILTDPVWSNRTGPVSWAGPKRVRAPGVDLEDLPPIDIVLVSHNHYDHLDLATLEQLRKKHEPTFLVGLKVRRLLVSRGIENVVEMDWWQEFELEGREVKIMFVPARHGSGRGLFDRNKTLWGGFVIQSPSGNVYFSGDTAYGKYLDPLAERFSEFRLALLPVGDYMPRSFMKMQHMSPDDAVLAHQKLNVSQSVGIHLGTFSGHGELAIDAHEEDLEAALREHDVPQTEFRLLGFGESLDIAPPPPSPHSHDEFEDEPRSLRGKEDQSHHFEVRLEDSATSAPRPFSLASSRASAPKPPLMTECNRQAPHGTPYKSGARDRTPSLRS